MVFSFRFWWLCNFKHTEGVPMAQLFATEIYTTIWTLPNTGIAHAQIIAPHSGDEIIEGADKVFA